MSEREADGELDALLTAILERYHYDFRGYARASLRRRAHNAMSQLEVSTISAMRAAILDDPQAFARLLSWFTIQLSDLFRDPPYWKYFRTEIVPVLRTYPSRKLWVAGCSTGEEAYSFAILLAEEGLLDRTLIYATDIFATSLRTAEAGIYELDRMRTFSENHRDSGSRHSLSEYYATGPSGALFARSLRDHIVFADHSLATDNVFAEVQVVSCRNVLIYFGAELQSRALVLFADALVRSGYLGLGPKESVAFSSMHASFARLPERWHRKQELAR